MEKSNLQNKLAKFALCANFYCVKSALRNSINFFLSFQTKFVIFLDFACKTIIQKLNKGHKKKGFYF